jgi:hypothetical protein
MRSLGRGKEKEVERVEKAGKQRKEVEAVETRPGEGAEKEVVVEVGEEEEEEGARKEKARSKHTFIVNIVRYTAYIAES